MFDATGQRALPEAAPSLTESYNVIIPNVTSMDGWIHSDTGFRWARAGQAILDEQEAHLLQEAYDMSCHHILIVEDDPEFADLVSEVISTEGYRTSHTPDALAARRLLEKERVDLIVLDLMLPGKDGLTFCRELRGEGIATPVIMVTAKGDGFDRVLGLEMGADDYLPKPFDRRELVARIKAVLRRSERPAKPSPVATPRIISFGDWRLDTGKRELISNDEVVVLLGSAEYELLVAFLTWPQVVLSREKLIEATHGGSATISDRSIDIQVGRLRRKLGDDPRTPRIIKTIWGDGYLFTPDVT